VEKNEKRCEMNTCFDVANYFLKCQDGNAGDLMSNLKLQKLVYYAQGFHLAVTDRPLFVEPIVAWEHGPVCPPLYNKYKSYNGDAIPIPYDEDTLNIFDKETFKILEDVHYYYGQFSAWKLRNLAVEDSPWITAHRKGNKEIAIEDMKSYFKTQIVDDEE